MNGNKGKPIDVHAFRRLRNGRTMIAESGVGRIIEVDKDGKIQAEVKLGTGGRQNTRMARKLDNGNYLVCAETPGVVTEYNAKSEIVWEYPIKTRVYGAIRLRNGNTLIASGGGASVVEVTPGGKVVWEIKDAVPNSTIALKWTTFLTELDNGNFIVGNCHAGEKNPQIFEITRDKKVVWQFNQYGTFGNGLACWQILNDQQSAQVRKLLTASTGKSSEQYGAKRVTIEIGKHTRGHGSGTRRRSAAIPTRATNGSYASCSMLASMWSASTSASPTAARRGGRRTPNFTSTWSRNSSLNPRRVCSRKVAAG
jgi:hypothetical protein